MQTSIPCAMLRGGTSKGLYLLASDLPPGQPERDALLLRLMGSPDPRQIDGLGGGTSVTSKAAILAPSGRPGADVDYTFAQVSVDKALVSYAGNCGNISAGVGPFAIEAGLVKPQDPVTEVRIFNTNTQKLLVAQVQTPGGAVRYNGDFALPGVPGTAAPVKLLFLEPAGSMGRGLLPTGQPVDRLAVPGLEQPGGALEVSIVDATNPLLFVRAADLGLTGAELPADIDANPALLALLEQVRGAGAKLLGLARDAARADTQSPTIPKLTLLSAPRGYQTPGGQAVEATGMDICARMMSMQKAHPSYAMTGAMCTAAAAVVPGTLVQQLRRKEADPARLRIGQPNGVLEAGVDFTQGENGTRIHAAYGFRTARLLMKGTAYI